MQLKPKILIGIAAALVAALALAQTATRFAAIRVDNLTSNRVVLGGGTSQLTPLAAGTTSTLLHGNASGAPSFGSVDLAAEVGSSILPVANGGLNLSAAADDNLAVGNGTTWQTKALTSCSGASSAVTYNTTTNAFGCNTISGGAAETTGSFTATFPVACTTTPTITFAWVKTGSVVTALYATAQAGWPCTSDSTSTSSSGGTGADAAVRPTSQTYQVPFAMTGFDNGGATDSICMSIDSAGVIVLNRWVSNACAAWTASGSKNVNATGNPHTTLNYSTLN